MTTERVPLEERRKQILESAIHVFAQKGFHQALVEEIAAEAGIGKGTVYEYFPSKKELFREIVKYAAGIYLDAIATSLAAPTTVKEKLSELFRIHLEFLSKHRDMARLLVMEYPSLGGEMYEWLVEQRRQVTQLVEKMLAQGISRRELRPIDQGLAAQVILGAQGAVGSWVVFCADAPSSPVAIATDTADLLLRGIGHEGEK
ncbi:MAG: TetR/AcrR family transcriptional regulator [Clostridia bacterium]|nr:MAG: TetR/AcrR family transcriptional regulator [Clostridia bacterium]